MQNIINILKLINKDYTYYDAVKNITGAISRDNEQYIFINYWKYIPDDYLYDTYKDILSDVAPKKYLNFFSKCLLYKLHRLNNHDTINNPAITYKIDADGYLTIYHGHTKSTLKGSYSWSLSPDIARFFGERNALCQYNSNYYVVTGKCRPENIIAYITEREEEEIVILNKDVIRKKKEFFETPVIDQEEQEIMHNIYMAHLSH